MNRPTALGALIALASLSPVAAQDRDLQDEVDFVRKLATELRFTSLALDQVQELQAEHSSGEEFKQIYQLGIDISLEGARGESDAEKRRALFKEALEKSREFIERYDGEPIATQARVTAVRASFEFGTFLTQEIQLAAEEDPERLPELQTQAQEVYKNALEDARYVHSAMASFARDEGSAGQRDFFVTWLLQCMIERDLAGVAPEADRSARADTALEAFEEFIFDVGEDTLLGQRGFFEMSKVNEITRDYDGAVQGYFDTVDIIKQTLDDENIELPPALRADMLNLLQEAYGQAAEVRLNSGDPGSALKIVDTFRKDLATYLGTATDDDSILDASNPNVGHPTLLTEARALAVSGSSEQVAKALELAQKINDRNRNNFTGRRAKSTIKSILDSQQGLVSGELLFEVAKGELQSENREAGLAGLKRAYAAMTPQERNRLGLDLYYSMAIAFGQQKRYLESTMAAIVGLERHGSNDDESTVSAERVASILASAMDGTVGNNRSDSSPAMTRLRERADELQRQYGGADTAEKSRFRQARSLRSKGEFAQAADIFAEITSSTDYYDQAQKLLIVSYVQANQFDKARAAIAKYREFLASDESKIPSDRADLRPLREDTIATHDYYEARMNYLEATGTAAGSEADPSRFEATRLQLQAVLDKHGEKAPAYKPSTIDMMARLSAQSGDLAKAEELYRSLRAENPDSALVTGLSTQIFASYYDRAKQREAELSSLLSDGASEDEVARATARLAEARRNAVRVGTDYLDSSSSPSWNTSYAIVLIAGDLAKSVLDSDQSKVAWKKAEEVTRLVVSKFENSADHSDEVRQSVLPVLGESLLRQEQFREATSFLQTAVAANPNNYPLKRLLNLAQGGFFKLDQYGRFQRITGGDQPAEAYERHWTEYQTYALHPSRTQKFDLTWYQFHLECLMFAILAATDESNNVVDTKFQDRARTLFRIAQSFDDFKALRTQRGPEGVEMAKLFQALRQFVR